MDHPSSKSKNRTCQHTRQHTEQNKTPISEIARNRQRKKQEIVEQHQENNVRRKHKQTPLLPVALNVVPELVALRDRRQAATAHAYLLAYGEAPIRQHGKAFSWRTCTSPNV
jgi:hypothetical protein